MSHIGHVHANPAGPGKPVHLPGAEGPRHHTDTGGAALHEFPTGRGYGGYGGSVSSCAVVSKWTRRRTSS